VKNAVADIFGYVYEPKFLHLVLDSGRTEAVTALSERLSRWCDKRTGRERTKGNPQHLTSSGLPFIVAPTAASDSSNAR
jgi:hypothetical protein